MSGIQPQSVPILKQKSGSVGVSNLSSISN